MPPPTQLAVLALPPRRARADEDDRQDRPRSALGAALARAFDALGAALVTALLEWIERCDEDED